MFYCHFMFPLLLFNVYGLSWFYLKILLWRVEKKIRIFYRKLEITSFAVSVTWIGYILETMNADLFNRSKNMKIQRDLTKHFP